MKLGADYAKPTLTDLGGWKLTRPDTILFETWPPDETTEGGIVLPEASQEPPPGIGTVLATNAEGFTAGDTVLMPMHTLQSAVGVSCLRSKEFQRGKCRMGIVDARDIIFVYPASVVKEAPHA